MHQKFFIILILFLSIFAVYSENREEKFSNSNIVIDDKTPKITLNVYGRNVEFWVVELNHKKYIVSMTYFGCYSLSEL